MKFYTQVSRVSNTICYRGYEDGERVSYRETFKPTLYVTSKNPNAQWRTLEGRPVDPIKFDTMKESTQFLKRYEGVDHIQVQGNSNYAAQYIQEKFPKNITYDPTLVKVACIDIEVASDDGFPEPEKAEREVQAICLKYLNLPTIYVWALKDGYEPTRTELDVDHTDIRYIKCDGEVDLLLKFIKFWNGKDTSPDVVTGWNVRLFDIPYLVNRVFNTIGPDTIKKFSPWGIVREKTVSRMGRDSQVYELAGVEQLDYYDLFQKFGILTYGVQESYKLDFVANVVIGEKKISMEEHGNLFTLYREDYQKFIDYNIKDVLLVERLDKQMGLINLAMMIAYKGGCNYQEAFGSTQLWDTYIYRELCSQHKVVPPKIDRPMSEVAGGYVKAPQVGRHAWVVSLDLNSLYPHLMMQYNISPETIVDRRTAHVSVEKCLAKQRPESILPDHSIAANGVHFRKDIRGVIPMIIDGLYAERKVIKKNMLGTEQSINDIKNHTSNEESKKELNELEISHTTLNSQQMAIKIMMNSLYGSMANRWFRYYDVRLAEAITLSGQLSIRWAEKAVNDYMNKVLATKDYDYVIAIDTDSVYLNFGPMVEQMGLTDKLKTVRVIDQIVEEKFLPLIQNSYEDLATYMDAYENKMAMGREVIADAGIWTAKKRYILNVYNSEGVQYTKPKLKIMGIEAVKSSTPASCRDALKSLFYILIGGTEKDAQDAIQIFKEHFTTLPPQEVAFPRGVSDVGKWKDADTIYKKGTPIHVRGALLYNKLLRENSLEQKYTPIKDGDKIRFLYLNPRNPIRENVIAFPDYLPDELKLHQYIDHSLQFDKAFMSPIRPVLDAIGWKEEPSVSLLDFFG